MKGRGPKKRSAPPKMSKAVKNFLEAQAEYKHRSKAAKLGWETRKGIRGAKDKEREKKRLARAAKKLLKPKLSEMKKEVLAGRGRTDSLPTRVSYNDYYKEKLKQKRKLGKKLLEAILESLQEDLNLEDVGWNIVYT